MEGQKWRAKFDVLNLLHSPLKKIAPLLYRWLDPPLTDGREDERKLTCRKKTDGRTDEQTEERTDTDGRKNKEQMDRRTDGLTSGEGLPGMQASDSGNKPMEIPLLDV